jgi:transposase
MRHRESLVTTAATHTQRMQKALVQMNVQLHVVLSDITGVTGMRILRDIVGGVTDPKVLAEHRDPRCQAPVEDIEAALTGSYRPEHLFTLRQNLETYDACQAQIAACDAEAEALLHHLAAKTQTPSDPIPAPRTKRKPRDNEPDFDVRGILYQLSGVDLTQIDAIGPHTALRLLSEIGLDMTNWPSEKHFVSWLGLAPNNRVSGGRLISSRTTASANRAATLFRLSAMAIGRTDTALGANYRRLAYRVGKPKAITAIARKLAILVHRVLRGDITDDDPGADAYDQMHRSSSLRGLRKRASKLGFGLVDLQTGQVVSGQVS